MEVFLFFASVVPGLLLERKMNTSAGAAKSQESRSQVHLYAANCMPSFSHTETVEANEGFGRVSQIPRA